MTYKAMLEFEELHIITGSEDGIVIEYISSDKVFVRSVIKQAELEYDFSSYVLQDEVKNEDSQQYMNSDKYTNITDTSGKLIYCSKGKVMFEIHSKESCEKFCLEKPNQVLFIPAGVSYKYSLSPKSTLVILALKDYDPKSETKLKDCECRKLYVPESIELPHACKIFYLKTARKEEPEVLLSINQYDESMGKYAIKIVRHYTVENLSKKLIYIAGNHAHNNKNCEIMEWLYGGTLIVRLHFPDGKCKEVELKDRTKVLLVPYGVHHEVIIPPNSGLLVLASENYDHKSESTEKPCTNCNLQ